MTAQPGARSYLERRLRLDVRDGLWSVIVDVTRGCNLDCLMCSRDRRRSERAGREVMTLLRTSVLPRAWDVALGCRHEALLHPELVRLIGELREARDRGGLAARLCLLTSGTLLDRKRSLALAGSGLDAVLFSVDCADPAGYEAVRRPARWAELERRLAEFMSLSSGTPLRRAAQAVLMRTTLPHLARTLETLADLGLESVHFSQLVAAPPRARREVLRLADDREAVIQALARLRLAARRRRMPFEVPGAAAPLPAGELVPVMAEGNVWDEDQLSLTRPAVCAAPWFKLRIDHEGWAFPCQMMTARELALGNIRSEDFAELVNGPAAVRLRRELLAGRAPQACRSCPFGPARRRPQRAAGGAGAPPGSAGAGLR